MSELIAGQSQKTKVEKKRDRKPEKQKKKKQTQQEFLRGRLREKNHQYLDVAKTLNDDVFLLHPMPKSTKSVCENYSQGKDSGYGVVRVRH